MESFSNDLSFNDDRVTTSLILETSFSKEIRILLKKDQVMKEHQAPYPIIIHLLSGKIDLRVEGQSNHLEAGSIVTLDAKVPHDLTAHEDSVVRLTLSKMDTSERVAKAANG